MTAIFNRITFKLAAVFAITIAAAFAGGNVGRADAAGDVDCVIPASLFCTFTHSDGIKQVIVTGDTPFGLVEYVNETYVSCPTEVTVHVGDDTVLSAGQLHFQLIPCKKLDLKGGGNGGGGSVGIAGDLTAGPSQAQLAGPYSACYVDFRKCTLVQYECEHLGQNCPPRRN